MSPNNAWWQVALGTAKRKPNRTRKVGLVPLTATRGGSPRLRLDELESRIAPADINFSAGILGSNLTLRVVQIGGADRLQLRHPHEQEAEEEQHDHEHRQQAATRMWPPGRSATGSPGIEMA